MKHERVWLAEMLDFALDLGIVAPADLIKHISTTELASALPRHELARLLAAGLSEAMFAPETIVNTLGVMTLVEHLSPRDVWGAIRDGMERALDLGTGEGETTEVKARPPEKPKAETRPPPPPPPPPPQAVEVAEDHGDRKPPRPAPPRAGPPSRRDSKPPPPGTPPKEEVRDIEEVLLALEKEGGKPPKKPVVPEGDE